MIYVMVQQSFINTNLSCQGFLLRVLNANWNKNLNIMQICSHSVVDKKIYKFIHQENRVKHVKWPDEILGGDNGVTTYYAPLDRGPKG